jgi:hypothetical protein
MNSYLYATSHSDVKIRVRAETLYDAERILSEKIRLAEVLGFDMPPAHAYNDWGCVDISKVTI